MTREEFVEKYKTLRDSLYKTKNTEVIQIDKDAAIAIMNITKQELLDMPFTETEADFYVFVLSKVKGMVPEYNDYKDKLEILNIEVNVVCEVMV